MLSGQIRQSHIHRAACLRTWPAFLVPAVVCMFGFVFLIGCSPPAAVRLLPHAFSLCLLGLIDCIILIRTFTLPFLFFSAATSGPCLASAARG